MTSPRLSMDLRGNASLGSPDALLEGWLGDSAFRRLVPDAALRELRSLVSERDPELLAEALLALARRMERENRIPAAMEIYRGIASSRSLGAWRGAGTLAERATASLNALLGQGPWQNRVETLGRRFVDQATDPAMIFAFGLAGGVAGLVRAGSMAQLSLRAPGLLTRGFGARLISGGAAYLAEVPAFVASHRLARASLRPEIENGSWSEELKSAALFLGVLKLSGGVAHELMRGRNLAAPLRQGLSAVSQIGGIYLAQGLQENLGMRPRQDRAGRWLDTLDTYLQMQVGGHLLSGSLPGSSPRMAAALETLVEPERGFPLIPLGSPGRTGDARLFDCMAAAKAPPETSEGFDSDLRFSEGENRARREILRRHPGDQGVRIVNTLEAIAKLQGVPFSRLVEVGEPWLERESQSLHLGLRRLRHANEYSSPDGLKGSYLNWLLRMATQESIRQGRGDWGSQLFDQLEAGASLPELELLVAEQIPAFDLFGVGTGRSALARETTPSIALERSVRRMPLSYDAQEILLRFARYQGEIPREFLQGLEASLRSGSPVSRIIEPIILGLRESPVSYLRMLRLLQVVTHDPTISAKLFELQDPRSRLVSDRERGSSGYALMRSQEDAYLAEPRWLEYLNLTLSESESLRNPLEAMRRRDRTEAALRGIFPSPRAVSSEDVIRVFEALGDPMSLEVATALRSGEVELRFLNDSEFEALFSGENRGNSGAMVQAFLIPAGEGAPRDQLVVRQIQRVSGSVFLTALRERLVMAVHEFDHHLHPPQTPRSDLSALREELPAHLRHIHYRAALGYPEELAAMFQETPAGPAMYLRDRIEAAYFLRYSGRPANSAAMADAPGVISPRLGSLRDQSDYVRGLLDLAAREFDGARQDAARPLSANLPEWLTEADWTLEQLQRDLTATRASFGIALREESPGYEAERRFFRELDADFSLSRRVSRQMRALYELHLQAPSERGEEEIRRRGDWLASLGVLAMAPLESGAAIASAESRLPRYETGLDLLRRFHPRFDAEQAAIYERAALGPIRDRDIAFDLDKTLGDTLMRYLAEDAYRERPEDFDVGMNHSVHQFTRMRLPYRGIQAMLLGLWAAGNRVRLYTASENLVGNHEVFFNDFPLIKVAMEIVPPSDPHRLVSPEFLNAAPHFMDKLKYREFYARHFASEAGRSFLEELRREQELPKLPDLTVAKLPFPDFPFDVLVDDLYYFAGDLMTVGLGRRWVLAEGGVPKMLHALERYFSQPMPPTSSLWLRWLGERR